jgi:hypothetical protein
MASRSDRKTTPRPRATKAKGEHPIDTISMNVQKAHGIVATLQMGLNEDMDLMHATCEMRFGRFRTFFGMRARHWMRSLLRASRIARGRARHD